VGFGALVVVGPWILEWALEHLDKPAAEKRTRRSLQSGPFDANLQPFPMRLTLLSSILVLPLLATSCRSVDSYQSVPMPNRAVELESATNMRTYFIRRDAAAWGRFPLRIYSGPTELGSLGPGSYMCWERPAGHLLVRLVQEREAKRSPIEKLYDRQMEPGVYYVVIDIALAEGIPEPTLVSEEEGRALLAISEAAEVR